MWGNLKQSINGLLPDETWKIYSENLSEFFYIIIGLFFLGLAIKSVMNENLGKKRFSTGLFWGLLAFTFIVGKHIPAYITGICVVLIGVITFFKGVASNGIPQPDPAVTRANADRLGYKVFIPPVGLAFAAFLSAELLSKLGANNAIGISAIFGLILVFIVTRAKPSLPPAQGIRLLDSVGPTSILPQLLAALGVLFTKAGVGDVISAGVSSIIPEGNIIIASAVYCIGMALFTIIMGNGFAAFSVITVGIGVPFLIMQGANPVVVGALGLTAGYCGTLCTPMAANFNVMPAALLETNDKNIIIKSQAPFAMVMLAIHIVFMVVFAF